MKKIFLLLFVLAATTARADFSPKPEVSFEFINKTSQNLTIDPVNSELIVCQDALCLKSEPLGHYGMQHLYCSESSCYAITYDYNPYAKIVIAFSDGVQRESNIIKLQEKIYTKFLVEINNTTLNAQFVQGANKSVVAILKKDTVISIILSLILEILAAFAFLSVMKKSYKILWSVAGANLISIPAIWLLLPHFISKSYIVWTLTLVFEILFVYALNKRRINLHDSISLGLVTNITSYALGMIISFALVPFIT